MTMSFRPSRSPRSCDSYLSDEIRLILDIQMDVCLYKGELSKGNGGALKPEVCIREEKRCVLTCFNKVCVPESFMILNN